MTDLLQTLRERKLVQWALAYAAVAFALLQGLDIVAQRFDWPVWVERVLIVMLVLGFFVTLVLVWFHGERGAQRVTSVELAILGLLLGVAGGLIWRVVQVPAGPVAEAPPTATAEAQSIAVLPFADLSQAKDQEYFSDGMSEELLNLLAKVPGLHVVGRTSSFAFKGKNEDLRTIGQKLGVAHVLEGSVRKSGDRVRITAQLIDVSNGYHLWSETYDRQMTDVFALQDEISGAVVDALKIRLLPEQVPSKSTARTTSVEAHNEFLLGRQLQNHGNPEDTRRAAERYEKAIELDPKYAAAYAALGISELSKVQFARNPDEAAKARARAKEAIARAFELEPDLTEAYSARANYRSVAEWDWAGAEADAQRALRLAPKDPDVVRRTSTVLITSGKKEEAIAALRRSIELDPLAGPSWSNLGYYLVCLGQYEEAHAALRRTLEITGGASVLGNYNLGTAWLLEGKPEQALKEFEQIPEGQYFRLVGVAMAEHSLGHEDRSKAALDALIALPAPPPVWIAAVYGWRGERDQAFSWLDRAVAERNYFVRNVRYDGILAKLRDDPRYAAFLSKVGLKPQ